MTSTSAVDYSDIQGLVRFGYGKLTEAAFLLLRIRDVGAARAWIKSAPISTAMELSQTPRSALQAAFTCEGLRALGTPDAALAGFSAEFLTGMSGDESRSRRLGDVGANAPAYWAWGGPGRVPHLVVMAYAVEAELDAWLRTVTSDPWNQAFEVLDRLPTSNLDGVEPFGFTDGISQPTIAWSDAPPTAGDQLEYRNRIALGEFLLGYTNEYGKYTDRPLLPIADPAGNDLPLAVDKPEMRDLGRNGTYVVFRQLQQDVRGLWQFIDHQADGDPARRTELAESMVGRTQKGDPLERLSNVAIDGVDSADASQNSFDYNADEAGLRCPIGSHIRRANPRTADLPKDSEELISRLAHTLGFGEKKYGEDVIASSRFHRLLRRGREYGPGLPPEQAIDPSQPDTGEHGIHFICINANISRQFELIQASWLMNTKFGGLSGESDPLLGNREPIEGCPMTDSFSRPQADGLGERIVGLPQFVTVRGGAYFFLPGISALRYLANLAE
jgi:deferrochelatase/peroxidase EfeB